MKRIKINKEVIASLMPTRNLLNMKAEDLLDQTFTLNSVVEEPADSPNKDNYDEKDGRANGPIRLRYMNTKTSAIAQFPVRGLLYADYADVKDSKSFNKDTKKTPMHTFLLEDNATNDDIDIPATFTVVDVESRKTESGELIYPTYAYEKFQARVDALKDGEEIGDIYRDWNFINSLPGTDLQARYKENDIDPIKRLVISLP